ncbi:unnamed protein product [Vicia faba]|uniref:Uncharacterized protein n=1 Tax=Vicia faba TaxID=3906 RepID=A0AAV0YGC5_VICFA|nr:unnamed protein product [Vicia faba]
MHPHRHRILLVPYPVQGHINPAFEFAKRLITLGAHATTLTHSTTQSSNAAALSLSQIPYSLTHGKFKELDVETNPATILVNSFEALEPEVLRAIENVNMIAIGPLIPSAFLDEKDPTVNNTSFGGQAHIFEPSNDYIEWLDSKTEKSVVYVSFGSMFVLSKVQMEEIARALLDCGLPFLWVVREGKGEKEEDLSCREELEEKGKIVKWCCQLEVLSHPSLGCFLTHCGWNSTLESLVSGVPMVAFPQGTDQMTNAKLVEDVWKTGVRVDHELNEDGIVGGETIRRCLEVVMGSGEKREELRRNTEKWKKLGREAVKEGGSSDKNLTYFLDWVGECMHASV